MFQQEINQYLTTHHYTRINLKAVLFDMDGVLFDSMKNHATAWHEAMKQYLDGTTDITRTIALGPQH